MEYEKINERIEESNAKYEKIEKRLENSLSISKTLKYNWENLLSDFDFISDEKILSCFRKQFNRNNHLDDSVYRRLEEIKKGKKTAEIYGELLRKIDDLKFRTMKKEEYGFLKKSNKRTIVKYLEENSSDLSLVSFVPEPLAAPSLYSCKNPNYYYKC